MLRIETTNGLVLVRAPWCLALGLVGGAIIVAGVVWSGPVCDAFVREAMRMIHHERIRRLPDLATRD